MQYTQHSYSSRSLSDIVAVPKNHTGMIKEALIGGLTRGAFKTVAGLGGLGWRAAKNPYLLIPGAAIGGTVAATKSYKKYKNSSAPNYTTYLRNQALSGNIRADEMAPEDLRSVRKLDMG